MLHSEFFVMHSSSSVHFLSQRYMYVCMYFMFTLPYTEYIEEEGGGGGGGGKGETCMYDFSTVFTCREEICIPH